MQIEGADRLANCPPRDCTIFVVKFRPPEMLIPPLIDFLTVDDAYLNRQLAMHYSTPDICLHH